MAPLGEFEVVDFDRIVGINLRGTFLSLKHELRHMAKNASGAIVNISSYFGVVGGRNTAAYVASKHGVIGLTKTAALDYARKSIRVNAVCPGVVNTPMLGRLADDIRDGAVAAQPLGRIGEPQEIAETVVFLCSSASAFTTGSIVIVDGGFVAQ